MHRTTAGYSSMAAWLVVWSAILDLTYAAEDASYYDQVKECVGDTAYCNRGVIIPCAIVGVLAIGVAAWYLRRRRRTKKAKADTEKAVGAAKTREEVIENEVEERMAYNHMTRRNQLLDFMMDSGNQEMAKKHFDGAKAGYKAHQQARK